MIRWLEVDRVLDLFQVLTGIALEFYLVIHRLTQCKKKKHTHTHKNKINKIKTTRLRCQIAESRWRMKTQWTWANPDSGQRLRTASRTVRADSGCPSSRNPTANSFWRWHSSGKRAIKRCWILIDLLWKPTLNINPIKQKTKKIITS